MASRKQGFLDPAGHMRIHDNKTACTRHTQARQNPSMKRGDRHRRKGVSQFSLRM